MPEQKSRKLVALSIEGFKRIKAAHLEFGEDNLALITGANGNGKSSVLDALDAALRGGDVIQSEPINKDMDRCRIRADLGDLIVTRTFKRREDGGKTLTDLRVESTDGALYKSPQSVLDGFLDRLSMDPLWFKRAKPVDQYKVLRDFVPGVDFDLIERQNNGDFEKRTDVNREVKRLRAVANSIFVPENAPKQRVSIDRLSRELAEAGEKNLQREKTIGLQDQAMARINSREKRVIELQNEIASLHAGNVADTDFIRGLVIPPAIDASVLQKDVARANETNKAVDAYQKRRDAEGMAEAEETKAMALSAQIEVRKKMVRDAVAKAQMPIEGIGFGEGMILYKGLPFDQASDAEQLRVSIAIAMAQNPELRVIRVRDGSLMDATSLKIVADMAAERDFLVIAEYVDTTGKIGFVMEDGVLVSSPQDRVSAPPKSAPKARK
jgi:energy-coupling factor transporter ATP-binding protein EcfA2